MTGDLDERLRAALLDGSDAARAKWAATGYAGLLRLRDHLGRPWDLDPIPPGTSGVVLEDNTTAAVGAIAESHPQAFLEVFEDERWATAGAVLTGLGRIDDPRATDRLVRAAASTDQWARMDAAIGLGRRTSPAATDALARLLDDDEYLVRYHALASLERIGDATALPALLRFGRPSQIEAEMADRATAAIGTRDGGAGSA